MEIRRMASPCDCTEIVKLWSEVFGPEEALLEKPQIDGSETAWNNDLVLAAYEGGSLCGTIHITFPVDAPLLCGLSGMCTTAAVRGTGLGRRLFEEAQREADARDAAYLFLGTSNPLAAKLYHSCGYSFLPGSNVMARFRDGDRIDMDRKFFGQVPRSIHISAGSPSMRIPLIPFVVHRGPHFLMDGNAGLFTTDVVTQVSCMGLYPRYEDLTKAGGQWFTAADSDTGMPGALLSLLPAEGGISSGMLRGDFFYAETFREAMLQLLMEQAADRGVYFLIAKRDAEKRRLLEQLGYTAQSEEIVPVREFLIPCLRYVREHNCAV